MSEVFLYKENTEDRDCCAYVETRLERFVCGHYFSKVVLRGACYSGGDFAPYENIKTILTKDEYEQLVQFNEKITDLGCVTTKDDDRYNKGIELYEVIQPIFDKLLSEENEELFKQVVEEEKEYLMSEYSLNEDDIDTIFNNYGLDYRDRAVVGHVFKDVYDLGYEEAWSLGYIDNRNSFMEKYFDFEKFGEDLANDSESYCKLTDGRYVYLCY